jgi:prolyl-tRNA editing enzyme YbaK/EbsC (Cys-tRNA(Pro) deacylase)
MNEFEKKIREYMQENGIDAEHLIFEESCHSVPEAAAAAKAEIDEFVKNICMIDSEGKLIVAIVKGEDRASTSRVAKALGIERPRIANADEMLEKTCYPCGGTPSFGYNAIFLIDERVMEKEVVYSGGGSQRSLIKISTEELQRANKGRIVRIRK